MLEHISGPADLSGLTYAQLQELASEIRQTIIQTTLANGGHLASNLGAVELTLALHRCFSSPRDAIIFDVGHQCYTHKLITGRVEAFSTLRLGGGISGFPRTRESEHDYFNTGHSGTALSLAIGLTRSREFGAERRAVAVVGDGAATGGVFWEALNDAGQRKDPVICVLNDNEMSISHNVGAFSSHLARVRVNRSYLRAKKRVKSVFQHMGRLGACAQYVTDRAKNAIKYFFLPTIIFEEMGFTYIGPVDGHDMEALESAFRKAAQLKEPVFVHVVTQKGRGYTRAENNPTRYHGVVSEEAFRRKDEQPGFSKLFGQALSTVAEEDSRVVAITAAMCEGTGLNEFCKRYPERFFDVAIAEQHALTLAAGMAAGGSKPVVAMYGTFLQRAYDQLLMDVCVNGLPVVLAVDRAGLVGADGETHNGVFDLSYMNHMPGLTVLAPSCAADMNEMLRFALSLDTPCALHYAKMPVNLPEKAKPAADMYSYRELIPGTQGYLVTYGAMVKPAAEAVERLAARGLSIGLYQARCLTKVDEAFFAAAEGPVWTLEDNAVSGGFGSSLLNWKARKGYGGRIHTIAMNEALCPHGSVEQQRQWAGIDSESVAKRIWEDWHV